MDPQQMKDAARRFITGIFDEGDFDLLEEMTTDGFSFYIPRPGWIPRKDFIELVKGFRSSFSEIRNTYEGQVAEGDVVVTRGTTHVTQLVPADDPEATPKKSSTPWVVFTRFEGELIAENWEVWDELGMLVQLGAIPEPG